MIVIEIENLYAIDILCDLPYLKKKNVMVCLNVLQLNKIKYRKRTFTINKIQHKIIKCSRFEILIAADAR